MDERQRPLASHLLALSCELRKTDRMIDPVSGDTPSAAELDHSHAEIARGNAGNDTVRIRITGRTRAAPVRYCFAFATKS